MGEKKRVLIVEDEGLNAMALAEYMEGLGYQVDGFAATGEDAVRKAKESPPDLVFMDVRLSGPMDGIEASRLILAEREVPIILISGYSEKVLMERKDAIKPLACLSKPFDFDEIKAILGR
jgi:CheY-like chemotaxis protein